MGEFTLQTRIGSHRQTAGARREEAAMMWIATVITAHGLALVAWWLRLRWQAQQEHAHRQDLIALARALPDGGQVHEGHSDGTWTRLTVTRAGDDDSDDG